MTGVQTCAFRSSLGDVVIQTYSPDNYSIKAASHQDYEEFYQEEIAYRKLMSYPPVANMISVFLQGKDQKELNIATEYITEIIKKKRDEHYNKLMIIGPAKPPVSKVNDVHRRIIYLKGITRKELIDLKDSLEDVINCSQNFKNVNVQFDFKV